MKAVPLVLFFVAAAPHVSAQPFVCNPIRRGDTAARLAVRLTNDAENRHARWFQILDPASGRFVSKADYDVILPGWRVCLAREVIGRPSSPNDVTPTRARLPAAPPSNRLVVFRTYWWLLAVGVVAVLPALSATRKYVLAQRARRNEMMRFAAIFVREFARPLPRRHAADRPVSARLRCAPYRGRVDILLAPNRGHTYPNVVDHRKNLDYDIDRVLRIVPHRPFVAGQPYASGNWVVIPFRVERV